MLGLELWVNDQPSSLLVRRFLTHEQVNEPFTADVWAISQDASVDLEAIAGKTLSLVVVTGDKNGVPGRKRVFRGICSHAEQAKAEPIGVSSYRFHIAGHLWLLTQRRGHRIFQHMTPKDIVQKILGEWRLAADWHLEYEYKKLLYKVQYGESDYAFVRRILSEAGISFAYVQTGETMELVFSDVLHKGDPRAAPPIPYVDNPNEVAGSWFREYVTHVHVERAVRPGKRTTRDYDFRRPDYPLFGKSPEAAAPENQYEQYAYTPGRFLVETAGPGGVPQDDKATARHDDGEGQALATRDLEAMRMEKLAISFTTNVLDLWPGVLFFIGQHAHSDVSVSEKLLILSFAVEGTPDEEWSMRGHAAPAKVPCRPPSFPRPRARLQSAVVVGPTGQEIHTDEHGRVRVQFPWDRDGKEDENSTPWIRTSQGWAGKGYGMLNLPRIGQEVLVDFLDGDPEHPMIVGRVFNAQEPPVYGLPEFKTRSGWKSDSSPDADGYNHIYFDDVKASELVDVMGQKNLRHLVKNDETMTVGHDRDKVIEVDEIETTQKNHVQVVEIDRNDETGNDKTTVIGKDRKMLVKGDETERTFMDHELAVMKDQDIFVGGQAREMSKDDVHSIVAGDAMEKVGGHRSIQTTENKLLKVGGRYASYAKESYFIKAPSNLVLEAGFDLTLRGPAGFIRITPAGVTIKGKLVKMNSGGSAGTGRGAQPADPDPPAGWQDEESGHEQSRKE